ncbi:MAG: hypothetical protein ACI4I1_05265 [Oscillospiraceae bacterium]
MKLSYRDKVIFVAAIVIVIIVAGIFLFIKPKFEEMNRAKLTLQNKQAEQADVEAKINTLPDIVASMKAAAQEVEEVQEYFMIEQDPYLNEQYVREILGNNVETLAMNTEYTDVDELTQYVVNPENVISYDLLINGDLYNELPQEVYDNYYKVGKKVGGQCIIGVTNMNVIYRDKTDYSGIYKFIDAVKDNGKTIIVTSFVKDEVDDSASEIESGISLVMYSIYPLNVEKVMEESDEFVLEPVAVEETPAQ